MISVALGRNEQIRTTPTIPTSLCLFCTFVRHVHGKRGQTYLLCQNDAIPAKYPRQPVDGCTGYHPATKPARPETDDSERP